MWKYLTKEQSQEFLLSLLLIKEPNPKKYLQKLYAISNNIKNNYRIIHIPKRNGSLRTIYEPSITLKHIQRQILTNILNNKTISQYAKAYHKGISLKENAIVHLKQKQILKLDIKDFFPSIKFYHVYKSCFPIEYFPKEIGMLLTYLCTYEDYLPQGAPTSSYISNLVLKNFDEELGTWCTNNKINYTRYSDDLTFSGDFGCTVVIKKVNQLLKPYNLKLNEAKTKVIKNSRAQIVTGLVVNQKLQTRKKYRQQIRQEMYYIKKYGLDSHLQKIKVTNKEKYLNSLKGRINYCLQIDPANQEFCQYWQFLNHNYHQN